MAKRDVAAADADEPAAPGQPGAPQLSVPVPPDPGVETNRPGPAPAGAPPLSVPIPPETPDESAQPGPNEPPLSVPART